MLGKSHKVCLLSTIRVCGVSGLETASVNGFGVVGWLAGALGGDILHEVPDVGVLEGPACCEETAWGVDGDREEGINGRACGSNNDGCGGIVGVAFSVKPKSCELGSTTCVELVGDELNAAAGRPPNGLSLTSEVKIEPALEEVIEGKGTEVETDVDGTGGGAEDGNVVGVKEA